MASTVVLASSNLIHSIEYSKRLPNLRLAIGKKRAVVGFQDQPLHLGGTVASRQARRGFLVYSIQPGNHHPPTDNSLSSWQQWIGMITALIVPFFSRKWIMLLKIKDEVDTVVEETEKIVDRIEDVAETVDKVAKDVADHLPEGGKLRNAVVFVEGVAEEIAREAHLVEDFLHEVEDVEEKIELLVESVKDQNKHVDGDFKAS
ncbi:hypothetical protein HanPI659440_Chr02g0050511 [Helianthus annuus]|uniref:Uncharacterized protein n=1 Tax=Helianthus annuus TaxID=4232 RepID=A0A251RRU9_HELAN|nr:uncharacterized protein LOC110921862 [Helianthus annuus]KAF5818584.1 hypothetical protein HanXRQr2_Chr02g0067031 [Helianthus annuus]KAJ0604842.1 hypothetical protein HanHA300_Chr02g0054881 [Helianthus annuus]KAJ0618857.1 hypothetical protein HanHA89_Chr02g0058351 [Helianthus annuus]KAJ0777315.1 hypothetical protein HanLR1_Chr02g0055981 [Helianthus annuus]KAJ0805481.1 hypothetical protein HanPI659440_Chr02g0050511 [Helianthus annuus]